MKKFLALTLALVMSLSLAACGGQKADETPADNTDQTEQPADTTEEYRIAMITDYGDITDQSFNQTTYEACKAFCEANSVEFKYYKPAGDSTAERVAMVDAAVADNYNVIVMPGFAFGETVTQVRFTLNGITWQYRMAPTDDVSETIPDISEFTGGSLTAESTVRWCTALLRWDEGGAGCIIWRDMAPGLAYSLTTDSGASEDALSHMAALVFQPAQDES